MNNSRDNSIDINDIDLTIKDTTKKPTFTESLRYLIIILNAIFLGFEKALSEYGEKNGVKMGGFLNTTRNGKQELLKQLSQSKNTEELKIIMNRLNNIFNTSEHLMGGALFGSKLSPVFDQIDKGLKNKFFRDEFKNTIKNRFKEDKIKTLDTQDITLLKNALPESIKKLNSEPQNAETIINNFNDKIDKLIKLKEEKNNLLAKSKKPVTSFSDRYKFTRATKRFFGADKLADLLKIIKSKVKDKSKRNRFIDLIKNHSKYYPKGIDEDEYNTLNTLIEEYIGKINDPNSTDDTEIFNNLSNNLK